MFFLACLRGLSPDTPASPPTFSKEAYSVNYRLVKVNDWLFCLCVPRNWLASSGGFHLSLAPTCLYEGFVLWLFTSLTWVQGSACPLSTHWQHERECDCPVTLNKISIIVEKWSLDGFVCFWIDAPLLQCWLLFKWGDWRDECQSEPFLTNDHPLCRPRRLQLTPWGGKAR